MSDPDRLADILVRRSAPIWPNVREDIDWLVGEIQDRRTDLVMALSQLQDALGEIARLRALLEPSVTMTSPTVYEAPKDEAPPTREG